MSHPNPTGEQRYAGERLGLPERGSGSVAGWGRRAAALLLDWIPSVLVASLFTGSSDPGAGIAPLVPLLVFLVEATLLTGLVGGSFGQLVLRVAVVRLDGRPVTILQALIRTLLICLVIPPVVYNRDNRGLHDLAVGTVTVLR